ncbi:conserved hypothetical protein [Lodderomyces elongisporus NRRL YB-4239]|uniref:Ataxin-10 homolog n=1 Tax=Lodderomyces elongisporus (strain ATCC 11503 / CBS 2605 / JCM 1781 / NBRC 1676 / NRRL YB-4239) TaxID=379508 RepID=A5E245_LODEL|nr:conserved hypothetical protein [Lodderomyces elongisporus NRRL YB-4239]
MSNVELRIEQTLQWLKSTNQEGFDSCIAQLSLAVKETAEDQNTPVSLNHISSILEYAPPKKNVYKLRLYRGLLLIVRNKAVLLSDGTVYSKVVKSFQNFIVLDNPTGEEVENEEKEEDEDWNKKVIEVYWQTMANFPRKHQLLQKLKELKEPEEMSDTEDLDELNKLFKTTKVFPRSPVIHFLFRQFFTEDPDVTNENLLQLLKIEDNHVLAQLYKLYESINFEDITHDSKMLLHLLYDVITHESFGKWVNTVQTSTEVRREWLELSSTILQTSDDWNNYQLVALLDWVVYIFCIVGGSLTKDNLNDSEIEYQILPALSILADLSKFNATVQFLTNMQESFLPVLIKVFKLIHENVKQLTIKSKIEEVVGYPHAKSYIITILSYMCYQSFPIQEQIRELGGLTLVLSNCVIDNNNPFIKEQAILCTKYLLDKNPSNQKIVAELEAKKVIDDDVLQEVGYKVDVIDGNVTINKKNDQQQKKKELEN